MARYATAILAAMGFAAGGWLTAAAQVTTPPADDERVIDGRSDDVGKADVPGGDAEATTQHDADRPAPPAGVEEAPKGAIDRENRERKTPDADAAADVNRNDLGMQFRFDEDADERISVQSVDEDGRAWQAGFREGDQIITVDGRTYDSEDKLRTFLNRRSDRRIPFVVERNGEQRTLYWSADAGYDAKTDRFNDRNDREDAIGRRDHDLKKHDREADVSGRAAIGVHLVDTQWGPHVSHVVEGSPADHAGIREGDFVLGYGGHRYCSAKQFAGALGDGAHNGHMNVHVWRNGNSFFANVEPQPYDLVYADDLEGRGELDQQFAGRGRRARDMNRREAARPDLNLLNQVDQMQAEIDTLKAELRTLQRQMRDMRAARGAGDADARDFNERDPNGTLDDGRGLDAVPPLRNDRIDPLSPRDRTDGIDRGATTPELDDRGVNDRSLRRPGTADDIAPPEPPAGDRGTDAGIRGRGAAAESGDSSIGVPATNETPGAIDSPSDRGGASDATDTGAGTSGTGGTGAGGTGGTGN